MRGLQKEAPDTHETLSTVSYSCLSELLWITHSIHERLFDCVEHTSTLVFLSERPKRLAIRLGTAFVSSSGVHCADGRASLVPRWYFQSWEQLSGEAIVL